VGPKNPSHKDVHEGLSSKIQNEFAHGGDLFYLHHASTHDQTNDWNDEGFYRVGLDKINHRICVLQV